MNALETVLLDIDIRRHGCGCSVCAPDANVYCELTDTGERCVVECVERGSGSTRAGVAFVDEDVICEMDFVCSISSRLSLVARCSVYV